MLLKILTRYESAQTELNAAWNAASEDMYKAAAEAGQGQPGAEGGTSRRKCTGCR